jgi:hypothetical protein
MTIHRHVRKVVLASFATSLMILQLSAALVRVQPTQVAIVAGHHASLRHATDRRVTAKRLVASLPMLADYQPALYAAGELVPLEAPLVLVRHARACSARGPPLS